MEPFAKAAKFEIDTRFGNDQSADLADLRANQQGKVILVCWRHPTFGSARCIGSTPETFLRMQMARCRL